MLNLRGSSIGARKCWIGWRKCRSERANVGSDGANLRQWSQIVGCVELCVFAFSGGRLITPLVPTHLNYNRSITGHGTDLRENRNSTKINAKSVSTYDERDINVDREHLNP